MPTEIETANRFARVMDAGAPNICTGVRFQATASMFFRYPGPKTAPAGVAYFPIESLRDQPMVCGREIRVEGPGTVQRVVEWLMQGFEDGSIPHGDAWWTGTVLCFRF